MGEHLQMEASEGSLPLVTAHLTVIYTFRCPGCNEEQTDTWQIEPETTTVMNCINPQCGIRFEVEGEE